MNLRLKYQLMAGVAMLCLLLFSTCCSVLPKFTSDQSLRARIIEQIEDSHGPLSFARSEEINTATDHINLETYILDDDEVGGRFIMALIARQQAGFRSI